MGADGSTGGRDGVRQPRLYRAATGAARPLRRSLRFAGGRLLESVVPEGALGTAIEPGKDGDMLTRHWLWIAAVLGGLAVVVGAFAAHGLESHLQKKYAGQTQSRAGERMSAARKYLGDFETGARYQMYHALALLGVGLLAQRRTKWSVEVAGWSFLLGTVLFSGSLYALVLTGQTWWGIVAPFGGGLLIFGWAALAMAACPCGSPLPENPEASK